jgi:hypothetical protein
LNIENPTSFRTCPEGHVFQKTSTCPICPICEEAQKPLLGFLSKLSAPARRGLENAGIEKLTQLITFSAKDLLQLHGMGKSSLPILEAELKKAGLTLKS